MTRRYDNGDSSGFIRVRGYEDKSGGLSAAGEERVKDARLFEYMSPRSRRRNREIKLIYIVPQRINCIRPFEHFFLPSWTPDPSTEVSTLIIENHLVHYGLIYIAG